MKNRFDAENRLDEKEGSGRLSRRGARAYQMALEAVFSIPIAIGLGYWADSAWGTAPVFLVVGVVLGFSAFVLRLLRMRTLVEQGADESAAESAEKAAETPDEP